MLRIDKRTLWKNLANNAHSLTVDVASFKKGYTEVLTETVDKEIMTPQDDTRIVVYNIVMTADGNIGTVKLDFVDGAPITRFYSSAHNRLKVSDVGLTGDNGQAINLEGGSSDNECFILVSYAEINGK